MACGRVVLLGLTCLLLVGCGGSASTSAAPQLTARTGAPTTFDAAKGTPLPSAASRNTSLGGEQQAPASVALDGYTAFVTTGTAVQVVNTPTGRVVGSVSPRSTVSSPAGGSGTLAGSAAAPPLIADVGGKPVALAGYIVQLAQHGTTPPSLAVEVDAVTADAGLAWDVVAPLPGQPGQTQSLSGNPDVEWVGTSGSTVVAAFGDSDDGFSTMALDTARHKLLWQSQSFLASAVVGATVIGTTDSAAPSALGTHGNPDTLHLAGLSIAQGKTQWHQSEGITAANVQQAGPAMVMVEAADSGSGNDLISLLNAASGVGKTIANQPEQASVPLPWTCQYGGQSVVVCDNPDGAQASAAFAVDGTTGNTLWQLPDPKANRTALTITAVYDDTVYGTTPSGSPVALNAKSGKDVNDSPGVAPVVVDPDVGIADSPTSTQLEAYPATG